jgi:2-keto-4-pentenoate hydratase/2-oxohepta-3-ene-1,7-dioic acid hydratase in catechol pathway
MTSARYALGVFAHPDATHGDGFTGLVRGDLVLTGSPAGNGAHWGVYLAEGDLIEGEITGLGTQRNRCIRKEGRS